MKKKLFGEIYIRPSATITKILLTMKLTLLFSVIFSFQICANVLSQQINLKQSTKGQTVRKVLKMIEDESNVRFFYNDDYKQLNDIVTGNFESGALNDMLSDILKASNLTFRIMDNNFIVIYPVELVQNLKVSGTVTDATTGEPLIGANITVEGTTLGTTTDINGKYMLEVPSATVTLVFSFIGYNSETVPVSGQSVIDIKLIADIKSLDEVVVVGYGTQKKSDLTGAISQVRASDMENRTIVRPEQALQGKSAGVQIIQTSGAPGKSSTVRIRGFSSNSTSDPLYVVDGLRTDDIGAIDPNNIETIEVLKDAASAAIYGAEAGNGVVLITTKKGKQGTSKLTYDFQYITNSLARIPKVMNASEYINYMTEGNIITPNEIDNLWDGKTDTDWTKVAFENSIMQKHNIGWQGGNDRGTYYMSFSYLDQDGIVKGKDDIYNRLTGMINADYKVKPWLRVGTTTTLEKWKSKAVSENSEYGSLLAAVLTMDPLTPDVFDADKLPAYMQNLLDGGRVLLRNEKGQYYGISRVFESEQVHPMIMRDRTDANNSGGNILGTFYGDFTPLKGLKFTSKLGYRASFMNVYSFDNIFYANAVAHNDNINVSRTSSNIVYYQWENFANYELEKGDHKVGAMLGLSYSDNTSTSVNGSGNEIIKDSPLFRDLNYLTPTATKSVGGGYSYLRQFSYFGRLTYNYADKYLVQASVRRDAGDESILPKNNRWGTFPAVSAGYVISKEGFFPQNAGISLLKIRASWGQNGSTGPLGGYVYRASISSAGSYPFYNTVAYQTASKPNTLNNPELKWETSEQLDFGLDIRALKDRLTFTFDYFDKKTKDLLVAITPPLETGVSSTTVNAGNVSNKGLEFELGWNDHIRDFNYSVRANLSTLKNKVTYLDPSISRIAGASYHTYSGVTAFEVGYPVWYMRGYQLADIDNATGDPVFVDQLTMDTNGDGIKDQADGVINDQDKVMIGSAIPDFTYGVTLTGAYKGFDLTVFGAGSQGNDIFNCLTRVDRPRGNRLKVFYDERWTAGTPDASRPRPNANGEDKYWISNGVIFNGSFFKIKEIQLGYTLPKKIIRKASLTGLRLYISLDDWFVFTSYPGMDPESSAGSTSAMGLDKGSYPTSRKAVFGLNLTF